MCGDTVTDGWIDNVIFKKCDLGYSNVVMYFGYSNIVSVRLDLGYNLVHGVLKVCEIIGNPVTSMHNVLFYNP